MSKNLRIFFIITLFIFCIGYTCINAYPDNDLWARLIVGEHLVEQLNILKNDFLSYTPTHAWYDHEWGASIFFYIALKHWGDAGLMLLKGILCALTMFVCFKTVELRKPQNSVSYNLLYYVIMFFVIEKSLGATPRCLLFTILFFSIFLYVLEKSRLNNKKILISLPILMLFWCNIHGGCLSGLGLIFLYIIGEFLNKQPIKEYIITLISCLGVLFINPYGFEYVKFLFSAGTKNRALIAEWESPFLLKNIDAYLRYKLYLPIMMATYTISTIKNKISFNKLDKTKLIVILVTAILSILHIRQIVFFVLVAGVFLYDDFYNLINELLNKIKTKLNINKETEKTIFLAKEIFVYFFILILTLPMVLAEKKELQIISTKYPVYAVEFIKQNELKGNLYVNFDWGSYVSYKLYPNNLIVMDGRYEEVYYDNLLEEQFDFHYVKNDWYKIIRDYKTDIILLDKKYPVFKRLSNHANWQKIFEDKNFAIFIPKGSEKSFYKLPTNNFEYYNKTKFDKLTNF